MLPVSRKIVFLLCLASLLVLWIAGPLARQATKLQEDPNFYVHQPATVGLVNWFNPQEHTVLAYVVLHYPGQKTFNYQNVQAIGSPADIAEGKTVYLDIVHTDLDSGHLVLYSKQAWEEALKQVASQK